MLKRFLPALGLLTIIGGCVYLPLGADQSVHIAQLATGDSKLTIQPRFEAGKLTWDGFTTLAQVSSYGMADVNHLLVGLFVVIDGVDAALMDVNGEPVAKDIPNAQLGEPIVFENLHSSATYRIRAVAYGRPGTDDADILSVGDSATYTEVKVDQDGTIATASISVQLKDKRPDVQATTDVTFTPGTVHDATDSEAID
ncbi:hypothetical protein J7643_17115 [bacterium]|nr:hypothetical protein [bacterium]